MFTSCIQTVLHLQPHMLEVSFASLQLLYQLCTGIIDKAVGPMTLNELEGHFCCCNWQNTSCSPSTSAMLFVLFKCAEIFTTLSQKM